tara:strand:- start:164 stop:418 length:255 start_codon:yes stop_codon:yes gene_type:complete
MKTENKLIAEFMGFTDEAFERVNLLTLKYNTSWDWLMPVVEKMNTTELWEEYDISYLATYLVSTDINATYNAVIEFINEYNKIK